MIDGMTSSWTFVLLTVGYNRAVSVQGPSYVYCIPPRVKEDVGQYVLCQTIPLLRTHLSDKYVGNRGRNFIYKCPRITLGIPITKYDVHITVFSTADFSILKRYNFYIWSGIAEGNMEVYVSTLSRYFTWRKYNVKLYNMMVTNRSCHLVTIAGASIISSCRAAKSMQLIWWLDNNRFDLRMSWTDLVAWQVTKLPG